MTHFSVVENDGSVAVEHRLESERPFGLAVLQAHIVPLHYKQAT